MGEYLKQTPPFLFHLHVFPTFDTNILVNLHLGEYLIQTNKNPWKNSHVFVSPPNRGGFGWFVSPPMIDRDPDDFNGWIK